MSFLDPYMNYIKLGILALCLAGAAWLFGEMKYYQSEYKTVKANNEILAATNEKNDKALKEARTLAGKASIRCEDALAVKDKTIAKLTKIISAAEGKVDNESNLISSGNALLDALNSMYPKAGYAGGVCRADNTPSASRDTGPTSQFLYCINRQDALNLLMNKARHDGNESVMRGYLNSFQTSTGGVK
jgi:hypothetical protein